IPADSEDAVGACAAAWPSSAVRSSTGFLGAGSDLPRDFASVFASFGRDISSACCGVTIMSPRRWLPSTRSASARAWTQVCPGALQEQDGSTAFSNLKALAVSRYGSPPIEMALFMSREIERV